MLSCVDELNISFNYQKEEWVNLMYEALANARSGMANVYDLTSRDKEIVFVTPRHSQLPLY